MSNNTSSMLVHLAFHAGAQSGQDEETTAEICSAKNATDDGLKANVRYICKPKIFESLVGNVSDIVEAIGDINHDNDPTLNEFASKAGEMLKNINLKELRKDPVIRKETAEQAQAMLLTFGNLARKFAA